VLFRSQYETVLRLAPADAALRAQVEASLAQLAGNP
jgi:hypothetical protein